MKRTLKSIVIFQIIIVLISALLISCSQKEKTKLVWAIQDQLLSDDVQKEFNEMLTQKGLNYEVEFVKVPSSTYMDELENLIDSGQNIDLINIICVHSDRTSYPIVDFVNNNWLYPINEYLEKDEYKELLDLYDEKFWKASKINGNNYGLVAELFISQTSILSLNKYFVDKYNIDTSSITDIASLEVALKTVCEGEENNEDFEGFIAETGYNQLRNLTFATISSNFAVLDESDPESDYINIMEHEGMVEYFKLIKDFRDKGYVMKQKYNESDDDYSERMNNVTYDGTFFARLDYMYTDEMQQYNQSKNYTLDGNDTMEFINIALDDPSYISSRGETNAIYANSNNKDEAFELLHAVYTDTDLANLLVYGIEDVNYTIQDNKIEYKQNLEKTARFFYDNSERYNFGNTFITTPTIYEPENKAEIMKEYISNMKESQAMGFYFDTTNVNDKLIELKELYSEYYPIWIGDVDDVEESLNELNQKAVDIGLNEVIDEVNSQYNEWKNSK